MQKAASALARLGGTISNFVKNSFKKSVKIIEKRPIVSFTSLMAIILLLIIVGNKLRRPPKTTPTQPQPKEVHLFSIGESPKMQFEARVEKAGVIKVLAQSAGIVQAIYTKEGDIVARGKTLVWLSTSPAGGTIPTVARQLAEKSYNFTKDNLDSQLETIAKQKELAEKSDGLSDALRDITSKSIGDTQDLINLDNDIVATLETQLQHYIDTNIGGVNDAFILQTKQSIAGVKTGLLSLNGSLRNAQYSSDENKEPAQISNLTKEVAVKQLELQEKTLRLNLEISQLNLRISQISESLMYPSSPCPGTVERVYVKIGQNIKSGDILFTITAPKTTGTAVVAVSPDLARSISQFEPSVFVIAGKNYPLMPRYISHEPTEGSLHTVLYDLPDEATQALSDQTIVSVEIPVGNLTSTSIVPFIPIDAVFQTEVNAYVFIATNSASLATSKNIKLGRVYGDFVEVTEGISKGDQVILDRTVVSGDLVVPKE
jgi:multidrug efflux pump subunit AcrA (membrane-fusion protein)